MNIVHIWAQLSSTLNEWWETVKTLVLGVFQRYQPKIDDIEAVKSQILGNKLGLSFFTKKTNL